MNNISKKALIDISILIFTIVQIFFSFFSTALIFSPLEDIVKKIFLTFLLIAILFIFIKTNQYLLKKQLISPKIFNIIIFLDFEMIFLNILISNFLGNTYSQAWLGDTTNAVSWPGLKIYLIIGLFYLLFLKKYHIANNKNFFVDILIFSIYTSLLFLIINRGYLLSLKNKLDFKDISLIFSSLIACYLLYKYKYKHNSTKMFFCFLIITIIIFSLSSLKIYFN